MAKFLSSKGPKFTENNGIEIPGNMHIYTLCLDSCKVSLNFRGVALTKRKTGLTDRRTDKRDKNIIPLATSLLPVS